ncbi:translocation/assembly module TamB domain-containing protein [Candidatus Latescibacterota bacterium]
MIKKSTIFLSFILICISLLLFYSVSTSQYKDKVIRSLLEYKLEQFFGYNIRITSFETNILSYFQFQGLTAVDSSQSGNKQIVSIGYARVDYTFSNLLGNEPIIKSVAIDSLMVNARRDSASFRKTLQQVKKHRATDSPIDFGIQFHSLHLTNSLIHYDDKLVPLNAISENIEITLKRKRQSEYSFLFQADSLHVDYLSYPFFANNLIVTGIISPEKVTVTQFALNHSGLECTLQADIDFHQLPVQISGKAQIQGNPSFIAANFNQVIPQHSLPLNGAMNIDIGFTGTLSEPVISLSMNIDDLELSNTTIERLEVHGKYQDKAIELNNITMELFEGKVLGQGKIHLDSLFTHEMSLMSQDINLERLFDLVPHEKSPYSGKLNGKLQTKGPVKNLKECSLNGGFSLLDVVYNSQKISKFNLDVSYIHDKLNVKFNHSGTNLIGMVALVDENITGEFSFHTTKPGELTGFANIIELQGSLDVAGTISGSIRNPIVTAIYKGDRIRFYGFPLDSLRGRMKYEQGSVTLEHNTFSGNLPSVDSLKPPYRIKGLSGGLLYSGLLHGPVSKPNGKINITITDPAYHQFRLSGIDAEIGFENDKIIIRDSRTYHDSLLVKMKGEYILSTKRGRLDLSFIEAVINQIQSQGTQRATENYQVETHRNTSTGKITINYVKDNQNSFQVSVKGDGLNIGRISQALIDSLNVNGIMDFNLNYTGSLKQPTGNLAFTIIAPQYRQITMDSFAGNIDIQSDKLVINKLDAVLKGQHAIISGDVEFKPSQGGYPVINGQSNFHCLAYGTNVSVQILTLLLPQTATFTGNSTFRLESNGLINNPSIHGDISINGANLMLRADVPSIENINFHAAFRDTILIVDQADCLISAHPIGIKGHVVTNDWNRFTSEVHVRASESSFLESFGTVSSDSLDYFISVQKFDLDLLRILNKDILNLDGEVNASLNIDGARGDPSIQGNMDLSGVSFIVPGSTIPITNGAASVKFDRNSIQLDSLTVSIEKGTIRSSGNAVHRNNKLNELNLAVYANKLNINRPKDYMLSVESVDITCTKRGKYYDLDGKVFLGESRFIKDIQPRSIIPFTKKTKRSTETPNPFAQQVRMNILLKSKSNLWIDNNLARIRFHPEIGLTGTLANPNFSGRLSVAEGYIIYLDKRFNIEHGALDFNDPSRLNPEIDLRAKTVLKSYQTYSKIPYDISLSITGPLDKTVLELTSVPQVTQSDILTLLTVGATRKEITGVGTNGSDASLGEILRTRAEVLSSRQITGYFSKRVGTLLGLEEISIEGNLFDINKSSGPQLIASERINDRIGITYSTTVGHMNDQRVRLDYRLNKYFSLEGETDQKGRTGIDVKYKLRFK